MGGFTVFSESHASPTFVSSTLSFSRYDGTMELQPLCLQCRQEVGTGKAKEHRKVVYAPFNEHSLRSHLITSLMLH